MTGEADTTAWLDSAVGVGDAWLPLDVEESWCSCQLPSL